MCALSLKHRAGPVFSLEHKPTQSSLKRNNMKYQGSIKRAFANEEKKKLSGCPHIELIAFTHSVFMCRFLNWLSVHEDLG